jgi:hypothetical protein
MSNEQVCFLGESLNETSPSKHPRSPEEGSYLHLGSE